MKEFLKDLVEKIAEDPEVLASVVYKLDTKDLLVVASKIKDRSVLSTLGWIEGQLKAISSEKIENMDSIEIKTMKGVSIFYPLTRSMLVIVTATLNASIYKLKIDLESYRRLCLKSFTH